MCRFCTQHGDGKVWYLQASSYAADLDSDLERERRDYLKHFISDFDHSRSVGITAGDVLHGMPVPLRKLGTNYISKVMQRDHFGQPVPIEDIEKILDITTSVVRLPCLCRTQAGHAPEGVCLAITTKPYDDLLAEAFGGNPAFADGPDVSQFDRLTKEGTLDLLRACEQRGLMHSVWTFKSPWIGAICNCDKPSGCMAMRLTLDYGIKIMWKGEYLARIDEEKCNGCAACAGACPFGALTFDRARRRAQLDPDRCYGCGTCRASCKQSALSITDRKPLIGTVVTPSVAW
jgi:ferredoxin